MYPYYSDERSIANSELQRATEMADRSTSTSQKAGLVINTSSIISEGTWETSEKTLIPSSPSSTRQIHLAAATFRFFDLPAEMRNTIYE